MNKTYWWRISLLVLSIVIAAFLFLYKEYFCYAYSENIYCFSQFFEKAVLAPLFFLSLSLLIVSPFLFLVRDEVFKSWLRFAAVWFVVAAILVALTPTHSGGFGPGLNPTKESLSIWLGSLFVLVSLVKLSWDSRKLAK